MPHTCWLAPPRAGTPCKQARAAPAAPVPAGARAHAPPPRAEGSEAVRREHWEARASARQHGAHAGGAAPAVAEGEPDRAAQHERGLRLLASRAAAGGLLAGA